MKRFKKFNKVSTKITISFFIIFLITLIILNVVIYISLKKHLNHLEKDLLINKRDTVLESVHTVLIDSPRLSEENIKTIIDDATSHTDSIHVNFKFPDRVYRSFPDVIVPFVFNIDKISEYVHHNSNRYLYLNNVILSPTGDIIYVQIIGDLKSTDSLIDTLVSTMISIDILILFLSLFSGLIFAKRILKPINVIADTAELINLHNLNKRIKCTNHEDEIGRLIKVINDMIERLESSFENQNKFISDASHELRTPLSIINGYVDLLNQWGTKNEELTKEALTSIKEEVFNMTDLMEKLLFIAREENIKFHLNRKKINIPNFIKRIHQDFVMIDKTHIFKLKESSEFYGVIDKKLILQAIRALLENSVKYTPSNKVITISCERGVEYFKIIVSDEGIGIPKEHLPKLFSRFYRVDETRTKETGGNGLGLSIVKSIIDMHNGQILIDSEVNKGTTITLKLPV
jgi:signal transduction histidine kinase